MDIVPAGRNPPPAIRLPAARTVRKIALCGSHSTSLADAPWDDPSWEFWGHASSRAWYRRTMDRYFDLHPPACWTKGGKKTGAYPKWLAKNTVPIYMQKRWPEVPASVQYPKGRILNEFAYAHRRRYFANHVAWMIALAITEGVTHVGLFGVNYSAQSEYERQRGSAEYWLGQLDGRGVTLILPEQCDLLADPVPLYGYESHDEATGLLRAEYKRKQWKPEQTIEPIKPGETFTLAQPPKELLEQIAAEEAEHPRPEWAIGYEPTLVAKDGASVGDDGFRVTLSVPDNGLGMSLTHSEGLPMKGPNGTVTWPGRPVTVKETA